MSPLVEIFMEANLFTQAFNQVLEGNFDCLPNIDPFAQHLLQALRRPENITTIPNRQLDEITMGWHKAWEATSSSPLALHFGHYMASTFNPTIAIFNAQLANLGFTTSYLLKRWRTGLNIMLEKQAGNFNIKKLCIILLFEGDFNQTTNGGKGSDA